MTKNYGLLFDIPSPEHFVFGSSPMPYEILQDDGNWQEYLPVKEYQFTSNKESYACVIFSLLNCIEILIKRKYGIEKNYADAFLASLANTQENQGSSPQDVCELLRKMGVPEEKDFPFIDCIEDNAQVSDTLYNIALEFLKEFDFKHEFVPLKKESITEALKSSPLMFSVYAWVKNDEGFYYRPEGVSDVHMTTLIYEREGEFRRIFDTYPDSEGSVLKDYDWNTMPMIIKRFWIERIENEEEWGKVYKDLNEKAELTDIGSTLIHWLQNLWGYILKMLKN